jgi:hypothetical protein
MSHASNPNVLPPEDAANKLSQFCRRLFGIQQNMLKIVEASQVNRAKLVAEPVRDEKAPLSGNGQAKSESPKPQR